MAVTLARWRPFAEMEDMRRQMDKMFEQFGDREAARRWHLPIDLLERDDRYVLRADMPGLKPDEVKIEVEDDVLTISASHEETDEEKKDDYVRRERRYGSFTRSIGLPKGVTADDVDATVRDGILEVTFPKAKEREPKAVTITPKAD